MNALLIGPALTVLAAEVLLFSLGLLIWQGFLGIGV